MYDIIIIGSGPAGLSAAIYSKRANMSVVVIEKEYEGTGQIAESGRVDNYLGLPGIGGFELGEKFREHASLLGVEFLENEVTKIESVGENYDVSCSNGEVIRGKAVIFATGTRTRRANIPGEQDFIGKGVSYCAICDGSFYKGKSVAVLGGGDTALDDANYLSDIAEKVYLIHRRSDFRGAQITVEKLRSKDNVEFVLNQTVTNILGEKTVTGVTLSDGTNLFVNGVFVAFGAVPNTELLKELVDVDESGYVLASESGATTQKGLFVAGDLRQKKLRQVITAVSDGANAATSANEYLKNC